ncbi:MAG: DUF4920 domain-containing protein [Lysobacterales bacterium]
MTLIRPVITVLALLALNPVFAATAPEPSSVVDGHPVYGAAMPAGDATAIATALTESENYAGKPQKFSGRVTKVCQAKGCWMVLADGEIHARVMFGKDDFFIPTDTTGNAVVYGTLSAQTMSEKMARHLAKDAGQDPSKIEGDTQEFQITATSVMLFPES